MADSTNYGIIGNVTATNLVVGSHGRIDATAAAELVDRIRELERTIAEYDGPREAHAQLTSMAKEVATELERPEPDRDTLMSRLETIGTVSGAASAVAGAATSLLSVVERVL